MSYKKYTLIYIYKKKFIIITGKDRIFLLNGVMNGRSEESVKLLLRKRKEN